MNQIIKDNYGLIIMSVSTTINELQSFLKELKNSNLSDSPLNNIEKTIKSYEDLMNNIKTDSLSDKNLEQLKIILNHRLKVLNTQKEKVDTTIPLVQKLINDLN